MVAYRFNSAKNRLTAVVQGASQSVYSPQGFRVGSVPSNPVVYEKPQSEMLTPSPRGPLSIIFARFFSARDQWIGNVDGPLTRRLPDLEKLGPPPKLEDWSMLDTSSPWMLGANGKLLPRLPQGTKVGSLVMGEYGLYHPGMRKLQQTLIAGNEAGISTEEIRPFDSACLKLIKVLACLSVVNIAWSIWALFIPGDHPPWPFHDFKKPGLE